jgi:hypothetical protein
MKRSALLLTLVLLAVMPGMAQQERGMEVSLISGFVLPSTPMAFANYWTIQYGGGVRAGFPLTQSVTVVGAFEYYRFTLNESGVKNAFATDYMRDIWVLDRVSLSPSADPSSVMAVSANVRIAPPVSTGLISPYFIAGIGVMSFSMSDVATPVTSVVSINNANITMIAESKIVGGKETAGLIQGGIGLDFSVARYFNAFVEARYTLGLTQGQRTSYIPLNVGIKMEL